MISFQARKLCPVTGHDRICADVNTPSATGSRTEQFALPAPEAGLLQICLTVAG
jgi:hypothetical protein